MEEQWRSRRPLGDVLAEDFHMRPFHVVQATAYMHRLQAVDLERFQPEPEALALLPGELARKYRVLAMALRVHRGQGTLFVAIADPENVIGLDDVSRATGMKVQPVLAEAAQLHAALDLHYPPQPAR